MYSWSRLTVVKLSIIGLCGGGNSLHNQDWQVNTKKSQTKQVRQDAILGVLSIG